MNGYSWISVVSLFCYLFLLFSFLMAKKKAGILRSFMAMLFIMILWNGGSLAMRMQLFGLVNVWHHTSLLGMLLVTVGYYFFVLNFLDDKNGHGRIFWVIFYLALFTLNVVTNFFIPLPIVETVDGVTSFRYVYSWSIYVLLVPIVFTIAQLCLIIWRHCRGNRIAFRQLTPVISGLAIMLFGHVLATLPIFEGVPVDMLSGTINAFFLLYAMYKKKLFRISLLFTKQNYTVAAVLIGLLILANFSLPAQTFLMTTLNLNATVAIVVLAAGFVAITAALYFVIKLVLDAIFTHTEQQQKAMIERYSENITHMLSMEEILQLLTETLQKVSDIERMFVLIRGLDGNYHIEHTISPLDEKNFYLRADHPLLAYAGERGGCVNLQDFSRSTAYRSMWEKEKMLLSNLHIDTAVPLLCDEELVGLIIIAPKSGKQVCTATSEGFFRAVAELSASALKSAYTYEKAIKEAQKDDLTGLVNYKFFYELLDHEFEKHKDIALSLCLLNLDDFKTYNQMYGNHEGDLALQRVAGILLSSINESSHAARVNGDEFALILPGYDVYSAKCLAENIAEQIKSINASVAGDTSPKLTASIGICSAPYMASSAKELYRNADMTVYNVKRTGKNAVQMFSAEIFPREAAPQTHKSGYSENASTIYALSAAIDAKDHYTFQHSQNVAYYAAALAKAVGMAPELIEIVREAGLLHDIGKIGIREDILNKPGKLTAEQYESVKKHVENAVNIIRYLPALDYVIPAVLSHHERYDGKGYPNRLAEENIPITGRILSIADAFDAMTSIRNYKDAITPEEAMRVLKIEAGKQFDPHLAATFVDLVSSGEIEVCATKQNAAPAAEKAAN